MSQVVTLIVWCAGRFFLYTSYYAIFGALFGVQNFGKMVAIDNTVNGLVGLLQLPLTQWGLHGLGGNFTAINLIQVNPVPNLELVFMSCLHACCCRIVTVRLLTQVRTTPWFASDPPH